MNTRQANPVPSCDRCGKPLKYAPCAACGARGSYRDWMIFKRECAACSGSGRVLRCPDELQHIFEDLRLPAKLGAKSVYRSFQRGAAGKAPSGAQAPRPILKPPAKQPIPPPWSASYPNPWHPMHPRNPRNQPFHPLNPNSPTNPNNPMNPLNPNNPLNRKPFK